MESAILQIAKLEAQHENAAFADALLIHGSIASWSYQSVLLITEQAGWQKAHFLIRTLTQKYESERVYAVFQPCQSA